MNYFTEQNDLNRMEGIGPKGSGFKNKKSTASILDIFVTSIINAKKLAITTVENPGRFVGYVIFIAVLAAIMSFAVPTASKIVSFGGFNNLFSNVVPAFEMTDKGLEAEKKFEMKAGTISIVMDTTIGGFERENLEHPGAYIAIGQRSIKMLTCTDIDDETTYNVIYSYNNTLFFEKGFNNDSLVKTIPLIYITIFIFFVGYIIYFALRYLLFAAIYAVLTRTSTMLSKLSMSFRSAVQLCFAAQTIGILLVNFINAAGLSLYGFLASLVGVIITFSVIKAAMRPYKLDDKDLFDKILSRYGFNKDDDDDDNDDNDDDDDDDDDDSYGNDKDK